ncbi:DUF6114 domain-containing protein [Actinosynnema sp. NPDC023794]
MNGFARFRRSCPFSAGLLTTAAGLELVLVVGAVPGALRFAGAAAPGSWLLGGVLVVAGATLLLDPARRHFAGVAALVAGLLSLVGANLGGFLLGFLLAASGGALALAWVPDRGTSPAESLAKGPE